MEEILLKDAHPLVRYSGIQQLESGFDLRDVHSTDARIVYVFAGEVLFKLNGTTHVGTRGCLVLFRPSVRYSLANPTAKSAKLMNIDFSFDAPEEASSKPHPWISHHDYLRNPVQECRIADVPSFNEPLFMESMQVLEPLFVELNEEEKSLRVCRRELRNTLLYAVLLHLYRHLKLRGEKQSRTIVDEVLDYIHRNYDGDLSNAALSRQFNYHPNYLNRILKKRTGQSLHQYVLSYRANRALSLLQTTSLSVSEIADHTGFSSLKNFSQAFKTIYGYSPLHYR